MATGPILDGLQEILDGKIENLRELRGMPVWRGLVRARARVLKAPSEIGQMQVGEVLVCPMSDPDYMPAVKKAAAIVTDQGGQLCHAAIVARELQIPCVVGTKHATREFKTGDLLEVDATTGRVTKL